MDTAMKVYRRKQDVWIYAVLIAIITTGIGLAHAQHGSESRYSGTSDGEVAGVLVIGVGLMFLIVCGPIICLLLCVWMIIAIVNNNKQPARLAQPIPVYGGVGTYPSYGQVAYQQVPVTTTYAVQQQAPAPAPQQYNAQQQQPQQQQTV